jgi:GNAT superfamily N-acetyltransferase
LIRRARPDDAESVTRIFRESRAEAMPWLPVVRTLDEVRSYFGGGVLDRGAFVFEVDGAVAGFALIDEELRHLYVTPEAQGRGVGSALFERAQEARPGGFRLWVFQENRRARRFYEARGCRLIRQTDGAANEERTPDALYEWAPMQ